MKKYFSLLASVLCLAMIACGETKPTPEPTPKPTPEPTTEDPNTNPGTNTDPGNDDPVAVTSISLTQRTSELWVGDRLLLKATVKPDDAEDKTVTWETSDASVASIEPMPDRENSIIVTAVAEGHATVTAKAGDITASCQITVHPVSQPYVFSVSPTWLELPQEGGPFVITVKCTGAYHIKSMPEWVEELSVEDQKHTFQASANESFDGRTGDIVFCDNMGIWLSVRVDQAALETPPSLPFEIDPRQVEMPAEGGEFQVSVQCDGEYHLSSMPEWVTEVSVEGRVHTFSVAANPDTEPRSGVMVFCDEVGTCLPCMVKQSGSEPAAGPRPQAR